MDTDWQQIYIKSLMEFEEWKLNSIELKIDLKV